MTTIQDDKQIIDKISQYMLELEEEADEEEEAWFNRFRDEEEKEKAE